MVMTISKAFELLGAVALYGIATLFAAFVIMVLSIIYKVLKEKFNE